MHSKKVNQLVDVVDIPDALSDTSAISNQSTPYSSVSPISPIQSVTDSYAYSVDCDIKIDDKPQKEPSLQYKISVAPIHIPQISLDWSFSMSYSFESSSSSSSMIEEINPIQFDIDCGTYVMSSNGLHSGYHEWSFNVLKSDMHRQELGIVSILAPNVNIGEIDGIRNNNKFGARAVYGNIMEIKSFYYASYNKDNSSRCNKRLSSYSSWTNGDVIKVCLDLDKATITFMLNNKKVRKSISIQRNVTYYPFVSFSNNCKFQVIH